MLHLHFTQALFPRSEAALFASGSLRPVSARAQQTLSWCRFAENLEDIPELAEHEAKPLNQETVDKLAAVLDPSKWPACVVAVVGTEAKSATQAFEELRATATKGSEKDVITLVASLYQEVRWTILHFEAERPRKAGSFSQHVTARSF